MVKVEFIESYIKQGNNYIWNDNHGELVRCKDCKFYARNKNIFHRGSDCLKRIIDTIVPDVDFCSRAERKEE